MEITQGVRHLVDILRTATLAEAAILDELLIQLSLSCELEHEEDTLLVVEVAVEAENVWVTEVLLDLNLATNLLFDTGLNNFGFIETFESQDVARRAFRADHVDTAEFAFTERTTDIEVGEMPFPSGTMSREETGQDFRRDKP